MERAVEHALKHGYRLIDTATAYGNEAEVGIGIRASGVPRNEFFLTTKLDNPDHLRAPEALEDSLMKLGTEYLDLCRLVWTFASFYVNRLSLTGLMHWPAPMTTGSIAPIKEVHTTRLGYSRTADNSCRLTGSTRGSQWRNCIRLTLKSSGRSVSMPDSRLGAFVNPRCKAYPTFRSSSSSAFSRWPRSFLL